MQYLYCTAALVFALGFLPAAKAQDTEHRLGEHPAVIVKRVYDKQPYDYLSKFYPHPAWLYLRGQAPAPDAADEVASRPPTDGVKDSATNPDDQRVASTLPKSVEREPGR